MRSDLNGRMNDLALKKQSHRHCLEVVLRQGAHRCALAVLMLIFLAGLVPAAEISREDQTKATYIFNFARFTDWPTNAFRASSTPLVIGIVGTDPFDGFLDDKARGEHAHGRPLEIQRYHSLEEIKTCHILYVGKSEKNRLNKVLDVVKGKPVLTVSDLAGSGQHPIMVRFVTERNRVRFRINVEQTKTAGLTISSKVLREAEIVGPDDK